MSKLTKQQSILLCRLIREWIKLVHSLLCRIAWHSFVAVWDCQPAFLLHLNRRTIPHLLWSVSTLLHGRNSMHQIFKEKKLALHKCIFVPITTVAGKAERGGAGGIKSPPKKFRINRDLLRGKSFQPPQLKSLVGPPPPIGKMFRCP